jgi:hypothetical protein
MRRRTYTATYRHVNGSTDVPVQHKAYTDTEALAKARAYLGAALVAGWELVQLRDYRHVVQL